MEWEPKFQASVMTLRKPHCGSTIRTTNRAIGDVLAGKRRIQTAAGNNRCSIVHNRHEHNAIPEEFRGCPLCHKTTQAQIWDGNVCSQMVLSPQGPQQQGQGETWRSGKARQDLAVSPLMASSLLQHTGFLLAGPAQLIQVAKPDGKSLPACPDLFTWCVAGFLSFHGLWEKQLF